jgi:hypothetical protein
LCSAPRGRPDLLARPVPQRLPLHATARGYVPSVGFGEIIDARQAALCCRGEQAGIKAAQHVAQEPGVSAKDIGCQEALGKSAECRFDRVAADGAEGRRNANSRRQARRRAGACSQRGAGPWPRGESPRLLALPPSPCLPVAGWLAKLPRRQQVINRGQSAALAAVTGERPPWSRQPVGTWWPAAGAAPGCRPAWYRPGHELAL